ncbi:MAG TPA: Rieske (2Fe-2S) protein [Candidatus Methylacidiphilales bacterium]|jgi:Rieske Fe-S protein|nr:Rieske (2Fe-2S) protein [Candidatus Methylacidiphilales bacterium]
MSINRREFLILTTATAACAATDCLGMADNGGSALAGSERVIDAGPAANFASDGVYGDFRQLGFFVIRRGEKLFALSSICTHRKFQLKAEPNCSFYCKRHGSIFDPGGHVTKGPAKRDLPVLVTSVNETGHLLVTVPIT